MIASLAVKPQVVVIREGLTNAGATDQIFAGNGLANGIVAPGHHRPAVVERHLLARLTPNCMGAPSLQTKMRREETQTTSTWEP